MNDDLTRTWDIWRDDYGRLAYRDTTQGKNEEEAALAHAKEYPEFHKNTSWLYVTRSRNTALGYTQRTVFRLVRVERRVTVEHPPPIEHEEWSASGVS